jgi:uncharacterized phage protein (TIGR02218 family)
MRQLPSGLAVKLASGVTTLARAWRFTRSDGLVLGITDHDRDLWVDGTKCVASSGLLGQATETDLTLAPGRTSLSGALDVAAITQDDLKLGRWDHAKVEAFLVDWQDDFPPFALWTGTISAVQWRGSGFEIDISGPEAELAREIGRMFQRTCDADLGDIRCGVDMTNPARSATTPLLEMTSDRLLIVTPQATLAMAALKGGKVMFTSGACAGWWTNVADVRSTGGQMGTQWLVHLASPVPIVPQAGDQVRLDLGCDKLFSTCKSRFDNALNFRGCPTMPGNDSVFAGPTPNGNTGGRR